MGKGFKKEITRIATTQQPPSLDEVIITRAIADEAGKKSNTQEQPITRQEQQTPPTDQAPQGTPGVLSSSNDISSPTLLTVTQEQLQAIAETAAQNAINQIEVKYQQEKAELNAQIESAKQAESEAQTKVQEAEKIAKDAVELAAKEADEKIQLLKAESDAAIAKAQEEVAAAKKDKETLEGVFKLAGVEMPNFNATTNPLRQEPQGMAKELVRLLSDRSITKPQLLQDPVSKLFVEQKNLSAARAYVALHFAECKSKGISWRNSPLIKDVEAFFKAHGFLSGNQPTTKAAGPTIGTPGVAGDVFLDLLSVISRETHNQRNVWWQFTTTAFNSASAPSQNILVPRWLYLPQPSNVADYELATTTTYTPVQAAIGTNTDSQSLEVTTVPISVTQYGLGKAGTIGTRPVFIPEFHDQISLVSLMDAVGSRLMQNYYAFEEMLIRSQYERATSVLYNKAGTAVFTPGDVELNDGGIFTEAFANSIYTEMFARQMPTYPDGCYTLVLNPYAANQFKSSLGDQYRPVTEAQKEAVSNTFRMAHSVEIGHVSGYIGMYNNFHVFAGNSFGVGAAGTVPTVNTVTFGAGVQDAVDSFAFAPGCVGRGISLAAEIRASGVNPFQLGESYIWLSREGVAPMDLDATIPNLITGAFNQQTRCFKLRTSKVAV